MSIYREYDIRGIYGKDLTDEIAESIGRAVATFIKRKDWPGSVVVGNDIRSSGPALSKSIIKGLISQGVNVIDVGTVSFGVCHFSGLQLKAAVTIFVTASHLPPEWNGAKISTGEGIPIPPALLKEIIDENSYSKPEYTGSVEKADLKKDYINFMKSKFKFKNKMKIALDCGNGSMSLVAPEVFEAVGFNVTKIFCDVDPTFPNRPSDPAPANLKKLAETVKSGNFDFGVAFDGDGDRGVLVDSKGRILTGNELGVLLARHIFSKEKGKAVITVPRSLSLEKELKALGAEIIITPVGHTFVVSKCKDEGALLGSEESGHTVLPDYFAFDDALLIPLKAAEIIEETGKGLAEHYDTFIVYPYEEIVFSCPDTTKFTVVQNLLEEFRGIYDRITDMDGVRLDFDDGWILIRASNTSPKVRLYVEAITREKLDDLKNTFAKVLQDEIMKVSP
ncbi:MAG: phosphomannomutase/phosphoglucomutase [Candidatus Aenigmarchaeota archaeon]|nr:phosphomannomutase/phosphoglucomutase [Candidatus Aenigmarchaeota archaeon]